MILSILMLTIVERKETFEELVTHIEKQIKDNNLINKVEIVVFEDNRQFPVGLKRNRLIKEAKGEFVCFVDDDDWVPDDYVQSLYNAISLNPDVDCVGFKGMMVSNDLGNSEFVHSTKYTTYFKENDIYYRPPNHLNPIRKNIAERFRFPLINKGEDTDWALNISKSGLLKKEVFIDKVMYHYFFEYGKSAAQNRGYTI